MQNEDCSFFVGLLFGFLGGFAIAFAVAAASCKADIDNLRKEAVERGAAEYDSTTGKWQWKVKAEDELHE